MKKFLIENKKSIIKGGISIIVIAILATGIYFLFKHLGITSITQEQLQTFIKEQGIWGPLIFILVSFLQVTFIPIPGSITILAGNYLFGPWASYLYSFIGMFIGSLVAFLLGRLIGKPFIYWIAGDKEKVEKYLKTLHGKENVVLFFMFLFPFFPDDLLCSIAGILPITFIGFMVMQIITRITSIGATLLFMSGEIIPYHGWGIPVLIIIGILAIIAFVISYKNADKIKDKLREIVDKLFKKNNHN